MPKEIKPQVVAQPYNPFLLHKLMGLGLTPTKALTAIKMVRALDGEQTEFIMTTAKFKAEVLKLVATIEKSNLSEAITDCKKTGLLSGRLSKAQSQLEISNAEVYEQQDYWIGFYNALSLLSNDIEHNLFNK